MNNSRTHGKKFVISSEKQGDVIDNKHTILPENNIPHDKEFTSSVELESGWLPVDMEKKDLKCQLDMMKQDNKECYDIIVYIAHSSLIFDNSYGGVPIDEIKRIYSNYDIYKCLGEIKSKYFLTDYNIRNNGIKLHDNKRDYIIKLSAKEGVNAIMKALDKRSKCIKEYRYYYILLLDKLLLDNSLNSKKVKVYEREIIDYITNTVDDGNKELLIPLGELFDKLHDFKNYDINNCCELYSYIIWGYIEAHMSEGSYKEANDIIKNYNTLNFNSMNKLEIHLKLTLTVANLKHLMNLYHYAISDYSITLKYINENIKEYPEYKQYISVCYCGIAHSKRHIGEDLNVAKKYYEKAIEYGEYNTFYKIKSVSELVFIHFILSRNKEAEIQINLVTEQLKTLTEEDKYASIRISIKRQQARYRLISGDLSDEILTIMHDAREEYNCRGKRSEYNVFFEIGEFYRKKTEYQTAMDYYKISKKFAIENSDRNLETMCNMAIVLCEIVAEHNVSQQISENSHEEILTDIIETCKKYKMYINEQYATVILDYILGRNIANETIYAFRRIGMIKQVENFKNLNIDELKKIDFFML